MNYKMTAKHLEARQLLPNDLKKQFDVLVEDYRNHATHRHGAPYVSYVVLADLIMSGWRRIEKQKKT
jgi:hypothetical protein